MAHTNESGPTGGRDDGRRALLVRTRSAVLNVIIGIALMIAASGWMIRLGGGAAAFRGLRVVRPEGVYAGLVVLFVASRYLARRSWRSARAWETNEEREARFYRSHVGAALVAMGGIPLGLVYALAFDPSLAGVAPFWVAAMALGLLAIPRSAELDNLHS